MPDDETPVIPAEDVREEAPPAAPPSSPFPSAAEGGVREAPWSPHREEPLDAAVLRPEDAAGRRPEPEPEEHVAPPHRIPGDFPPDESAWGSEAPREWELPSSGPDAADGLEGGMDEGREANPSFGRWLIEMVVLIGTAFLLATAIKTFVVQPFIIPSLSMAPTLQVNDRVLVNKFLYRFEKPDPGDIVVFLEPGSSKTDYIKRVIAVEGQTVDFRDGIVYVDGQPLDEPYVRGVATEPGEVRMPVVVPKGHVWLMGDNRMNSRDSRWFGPQPLSRVLGEAFAIYWPVGRIGGI